MNNRGIVVLLVLFFGGLIGLWWADYAKIPDRNTRRLAEPRVLPSLVTVRPDEVRRIEIVGGPERIVFERRDPNRWQMLAPIDTAADPSMVETLAFNLKELAKQKDVGTIKESPSAYGLEPASRTIIVFGIDQTKPIATLEVGATTHEKRYVRAGGGNGIEVVDAKALAAVELPAIRWRDRSLLRFSTFQATALSASGPDRELSLVREGDLWRILAPYKAIADVERVEGVLAELSTLRVPDGDAGFIKDDVKDLEVYGLDRPFLTITVTPKSGQGPPQSVAFGKAITDRVGGSSARFYAKRGDQDDVVVVDARLLKDLGASPGDLHGKKVTDIRADRVDFIRLTSKGTTVDVARRDKGWERIAPLVDRADTAAIQDFLKRLESLEASVILTEKTAPESGLAQSTAVIEVWQEAGPIESGTPKSAPSLRLTLGRVDPLNKTIYARTADDPFILGLPTALLDGLTLGGLAFRDRQVVAVIPPLLDEIEIKAGPKTVTLIHPEAGQQPTAWRLIKPVKGPADSESMGRLLNRLSDLRAETLVTEKPESESRYGLDKPVMTVQWTTKAEMPPAPLRPKPGESVVLKIGGPVPNHSGTKYASVSTSPIVFTMSPEVIATFDSEWRDREILSIPPRSIDRISIRWPGLNLTSRPIADVKTKDPEWTLVDPPAGLDFDAARIKSLVAALSHLMTFRYQQYEGPIPEETGLFPGRLVINVQTADGKSHTLRIGRRTQDGYLMATTSTESTGSIFLLPLSGWEPWIKPPEVKGPQPVRPKP